MADFQLLSARIQLAGSKDSVVYRGAFTPLSYPEILLMQYMHGDDAVSEVEEVGTLSMSNNDLLHHLRMTYPLEAVDRCFPGARPNLPVRSDEFHKSRAVLMAEQEKRQTPGPQPGPENMNIPEPQPKAQTKRTARESSGDAGPFA